MNNSNPPPSRPARPKVVQPKPTNKQLASPSAAPPAQPVAGPSTSSSSTLPAQPQPQPGGSAPRPAPIARSTGPKILAPSGSSSLLVQNTQRGNPLLRTLRSIPWEFADIPADYQLSPSRGALFLSLKYHRLHPEYVHDRIAKLRGIGRYEHRLLLIQVDIPLPQTALKELTKTSLVNGFTLLLSWSPQEVARYLEQYKIYETKGPELIRERRGEDHLGAMTSCLTSVPRINRTDVRNLVAKFGSLRRLSRASAGDLADMSGFGEIKVRLLTEAFRTPFRVGGGGGAWRVARRRREEGKKRSGVGDGDEMDDIEEIEDDDDDEDGAEMMRGQGTHVAGVAGALQTAGADADGEAGRDGSGASKRRRIELRVDEEEERDAGNGVVNPKPPAQGDVRGEAEDHLPLDNLNDADDLAALAAEEGNLGSGSGSDPIERQGHGAAQDDDGNDDEFGSDLNLDELTAEEREELRRAMRMSMA
ncbi:hypothetical protein BDZ90DRAFT_234264 [Jaminaea rosea]|uniref:ERCC1-like central domain-containing protein n=1 Tax=Jaminaea rosea TaxID=1569628 RepID=A0A316UJJ0_9BASI|nr:hypothetical protein BDZ90DRAFT_234264 [Jaminaea rosea]PWN25447.1 hypothetical protein BDZ90DRAFT_234264 [Jaminaea rosea]